jgi:hypothetical protein
MDQWLQNPTAHTALDDILPCLDNAIAQETLYESKDVTFQLVNNVNQFIINGPNSPRNELNYNQSGPMVPVVCNPFHSDMTDRKCVDGEVDLNNAPQVSQNLHVTIMAQLLNMHCQAIPYYVLLAQPSLRSLKYSGICSSK